MSERWVLTVEVPDGDDRPRAGDVVSDGSAGLEGYNARVLVAVRCVEAEVVED